MHNEKRKIPAVIHRREKKIFRVTSLGVADKNIGREKKCRRTPRRF
jgi:hypothetical protein